MTSLLVVKTGAAVPTLAEARRDFEEWIAQGAGIPLHEVSVVHVFRDEPLPEPDQVPGVVVTGSPAMVTDRLPWSERTAAWLRTAVQLGKPVLGICYGHQLLAHAMGGEVHYNPLGRQIGTVDVRLSDAAEHDPLFSRLARVLHLPVCHLQRVATLPEHATLLGSAPRDAHHAFRVGARAWGVQFHPEFDAHIVRSYIEVRREQILAEGLDPDALAQTVKDTEHGTSVLRRFAEIVRDYLREQEAARALPVEPSDRAAKVTTKDVTTDAA